jgi:iron complex transport system substrate-binding protein
LRDYDLPVLRGLRAVVILACLFAAVGCGERSEPVGPAEDLFPLTITTADRPLTIPSPPQRIVVLKGGPESILAALRAPVVASNVAVSDVEGRRPDLVVAPSTTSERALSQAAAAGAPVYMTPDTSITEVERAITQLGLIVAEPTAARGVVRGIEERRRQVRSALRGTPRTRVFVDLGRYTTAPDGSLLGDLIREARGRNVAATASGGLRLGVEQLLAFDPDVYISAGGATLEQLRKGVRTRALKAVRSGRVVLIDENLLAPGPALGRGLVALARALHPDAFR